ncbi:LacI family DNA-binding transcriptional regulator [Micromonospora sp. DT47]|uniref:LacI family DNA-binding transcriptional regulator n=1 Tax=Micromonospora sp. DT47 TaxID=3393431 RepID=UPI003CE74FE8
MSASESSPPTMREVAAHAGVSVMTVSRALHGDPRVSAQTRARVLTAAEELRYRRNELARSLRLGRPSGMLGLVVTNLANPFYSQLALGVETLAAARGMKVVLSNTGDDVERERQIVSDLAAWRVEGMIVVPAGEEQSHLDPARLNGIPIVLAARPPADIAVDCVLLDDYGGAKEATARLLASGHRRIGFLSPPAVWNSAERLRGFRSVMETAGIDLDERFVRCEQRDVTAAERAAQELLALPQAPSAFFCANSRNAIGAYRAARGTNKDIALSCFDNFELADMLGLSLSVVAYDPAAIGRESASLLLSRIDAAGNSTDGLPPRRIVLPTTVVDYGREGDGRLPRPRQGGSG